MIWEGSRPIVASTPDGRCSFSSFFLSSTMTRRTEPTQPWTPNLDWEGVSKERLLLPLGTHLADFARPTNWRQ